MNKSESKSDLAGSSSSEKKKKKSSSDLEVTAIEDLKATKHHHHHHKHHHHKRERSRDEAAPKTPRQPADETPEFEPDEEFPLVIIFHLADQDASFGLRFLELKAPLEELKHKVEGVLDARRLKSGREEVSLVMPTKQGYLPLINQKQLNDLIHENISGPYCKVRITIKLHKPQNFVNIPNQVANMMEAHEVMIALERPCFVVDGAQFSTFLHQGRGRPLLPGRSLIRATRVRPRVFLINFLLALFFSSGFTSRWYSTYFFFRFVFLFPFFHLFQP